MHALGGLYTMVHGLGCDNARLGILEYKRAAQFVMNKDREVWNSRFLGKKASQSNSTT